MKTNIQNMFSESRSYSDIVFDCRLTVVRPSFDRRSALLKMVAVLVMVFAVGVGNVWGTEVTLKFGTNAAEGQTESTSGNIDDNLAYETFKGNSESTAPKVYSDGLRLYGKKSNTKEGGVLRIYVRAGQSCTIGSVEVTFSSGKLAYIKSSHTYGESLNSCTLYTTSASPATIGSIEGTSIHLSNGNGSTTQTKIQQVVINYTCEGDDDECTPGDAASIKAGDVVLIYYPSASNEFGGYAESGTSHWGDVHTYSGTPSGYYPFTVEAGSASGYWSFKNGSTYLAMSEGNTNKIVGSATINDASSWSVSINGSKEATITNKAYSSYLLKYNTGSPRFSSYSSGQSLPKIYKYCGDVKYYVTYYGNGNTSGSVPTDATAYAANASATVLGNPNSLAKTGSTFAGWNTKADGTGTSYSQGNSITMTGSVSLYAKWNSRMDVASVGHVTITATPSGASAVAEGSYANVDCGKTVTLSQSGVESGYTFSSWKVYKTGDENTTVTVTSNSFVMPAFPVTVSAVITPPYIYFTNCSDKLAVRYNANGVTGYTGSLPADAEYDDGDVVTISSATLSHEGYTFVGWNRSSSASVAETGTFTIHENTTLYAIWEAKTYKITSMGPSPAGAGTVSATYNAADVVVNSTNIAYGGTVTLSQTPIRGKNFTGWTVTNTTTSATISVTNNQFTMPASNVTVVANYESLSSCTITFNIPGGTIGTTTLNTGETVTSSTVTIYSNESISSLPSVTPNCGDWNTFVGWIAYNATYDVAAGVTTAPVGAMTAGTAYANPGAATTLYAVYRKTDGSDDFDGTNSGTYYVKGTSSSTAYYAAACLGALSSEITTTSSTTGGATPFVFTKNGDYYNISCSEGNYVQTSGTTTTASSDAALWTATQVGSLGASGTGYWEFVNKGSNTKAIAFDALYSQLKFNFNSSKSNLEDGTNTRYVPLELVSASTYYYSINPVCTSYTVTKGTCTPASSVLDASSHACDFKLNNTNNSSVTTSSGGSVTIYLYPNDDYTDEGATVSVDVPGNVTTINSINTETHTCLISGITGDITVSVSYVAKPKYTVTLYDNGVQRTTLTEEHYNAGVTLPSGNNCTPGSAFTFEGWTESAVELNADPVRPAAATLHTAGTYVPGANKTLYSVYSRSVDGCDDFAAGVSGAYKIYYDGSKYALTTGSTTYYNGGTSGDAEVFYFAYAPAHSGYTIRTSEGYLGWGGSSGSETISKGNATPYYWKVSGSSSNWVITPEPSGITRQFKSSDGSRFQMYASGTSGKAILQKSAMTYYYNTAICGGAQITFHDGGGEISGTPTTPDGSSWNISTHVLSGLENCDKITTFPTANYDGWTFIGWSTEDYSNSGKHTADHPEENASTDEPDGSIIYKTGGNSYTVLGGNIDLYPIFTRFPENEPFNTTGGGDYYIYYLDPSSDDGYGAPARVYAGEYSANCRYLFTKNCASATVFTFEKSGDYWTIKDGTKYIAATGGSDNLTHADVATNWTLSIYNGNQFDAVAASGRQISARTDGWDCFMNYYSNNIANNPTTYHRVYLGSCTERIFSSDPNPTPTIDLVGEPYVTATNGQEIRATATMTVSAAHLSSVPADKVIVSGGTGLRFATTASATPSNTVSLSLTAGNLEATTIYVYYNPSATEDGIENIVVTAKAYNNTSPKDLQTTGTVHARHLPADFVIAAKWEGKWYALPNTCTFDGSSTAGVLITVDNDNDPTEATYAPSTTKWGLRKTKAGSRVDGSHNDRMVFTERGTTETANNQQTLYNYNNADVYTNATYTNYNNTNPERYEWIPVTSDFKVYTLTNASESKPLILRNDCEFKAQTTNQAYDGKVRLLPATFSLDNVQIVEWKTSSVVIMYTGTETSATTTVGTNSASSAQTLSTHKLTHGIYELTTAQALTSNAGKNLVLTFGSDASKKLFEIPIIINGSPTASDGHAKQDVVIVNGGKLQASGTNYSYRNIYVYGGGKLHIPEGTSLSVNNIILRAGGLSTSGIGSSPSATYQHIYPQVYLTGTLNSSKTDIKYEYITDYEHWYHLCLPFGALLSSIHYPMEYYGQNVRENNTGSWMIKRYDGATRATGNYDAWKDIENDVPKPTATTAGYGYIFWGAPKKVTINGDTQRQQWGIQRMTMSIGSAAAAKTAETANKTISGLSSYASVPGNSGKVNDQGWNLIGNPYLVGLSELNSESLKTGKLVQEENAGGQWTGHWEDNEDGIRYVTIPSDHFETYEAQAMSWFTTSNLMVAGRAFFVQIDGDATGVTFLTAKRKSLMPAWERRAEAEQKVDIETGIVLSDDDEMRDEVNFWIKNDKTEAYEYNADYPKTPNNTNFNIYGVHEVGQLSWVAISPEIAEGSMAIGYQVPAAGDYTLSLSETYVSDKIEALYVTDHEVTPEFTTNLMEDTYSFGVKQAERNDTRFTARIVLKDDAQVPTDVGNIDGMESEHPLKFLYRDKLYILRNGVLYDATGKKVK